MLHEMVEALDNKGLRDIYDEDEINLISYALNSFDEELYRKAIKTIFFKIKESERISVFGEEIVVTLERVFEGD